MTIEKMTPSLSQGTLAKVPNKQPEAAGSIAPVSVVAEMRAVRARVKADPGGWTTRDYVNYGRRR